VSFVWCTVGSAGVQRPMRDQPAPYSLANRGETELVAEGATSATVRVLDTHPAPVDPPVPTDRRPSDPLPGPRSLVGSGSTYRSTVPAPHTRRPSTVRGRPGSERRGGPAPSSRPTLPASRGPTGGRQP
jgi:hypothetical protein